jgi:hypothetical protein
MEHNEPQLDPATVASVVIRTIDEIDESTEEQRDELLCALLCAAWGDLHAQNQ